jgi:hypothetical protein
MLFDHIVDELRRRVMRKGDTFDKGFYVSGYVVISDHGSQFYANTRDKNGNADHAFELFLKENGIKHILCGVNHSQINGNRRSFTIFIRTIGQGLKVWIK